MDEFVPIRPRVILAALGAGLLLGRRMPVFLAAAVAAPGVAGVRGRRLLLT